MTVTPASKGAEAHPHNGHRLADQRLPEIHLTTLTDASNLDSLFDSSGECIQLTAGTFHGELTSLRAGAVRIFELSSNCGIHLRAQLKADTLLIGCVKKNDSLLEHGRLWSSNLMMIAREASIDLTAPSRLDVLWLTVDLSLLGESERETIVRHTEKTSRLASTDTSAFADLCRYVRATFTACFSDGGNFASGDGPKEVEAGFLSRITAVIEAARVRESETKTTRRRFSLVQRVEDYMWEHVEEPLTLERICENMNCRMRSLIYSFKDVFGMGPMTYLKIRRLNAARRKLLAAGEGARIFDIAADFGFWHMGHFSSDYKRLFGTTASRTLSSARRGTLSRQE